MQKELGGVKKPQEALLIRVRKQQNQKGSVWKSQEYSGSYKNKLTSMMINRPGGVAGAVLKTALLPNN